MTSHALDPRSGRRDARHRGPALDHSPDGLTLRGAEAPPAPPDRRSAWASLVSSDGLTRRLEAERGPGPRPQQQEAQPATGPATPQTETPTGLSDLGTTAGPAAAAELPFSGDVSLPGQPIQVHEGRCSCWACSGSGRGTAATTAPVSGGALAAPSAAVPLQTLATYLTTNFWLDRGTYTRRYNLSNSGTGANNGTLTYNVSGWSGDSNGLSADRQALTREVFKLYAAMLGINFIEVSGEAGDIRFNDTDTGAYAYMASGWYADASRTSVIIDYSVVNVEPTWYDGQSNYDTYTPQTFFHEIGHALGLGHQGQYNYAGTPLSYSTSAQFANDSWQATMMSYWDQLDNPTTGASFAWLQTPMSVDWIALNDIYGSQGFSTANAFRGDTIYGVGTTISAAVSRIWNEFSIYADTAAYTIADGSGYDSLDVSNFTANQLINLAPSLRGATAPSRSNIGGKVGNLTIGVDTIIEAASGGSGSDSFYGNDAANTFRGGAGNDSFYESLGSDIYYGDAGNDWLYFNEAIDLFSYSLAGDALRFSRLAGSGDVELVWNGLENLSFNNVAYTYQQLVANLSGPTLPTLTIDSVNGGLASGAITNATTLSFSGTLSQPLSAGQTIALYRDGVQVGTAEPTAPGASSWSHVRQETGGTNTFTYTARVLEGSSLGSASAAFRLTVDTVAPLVGVSSLLTQDTTPLLSGTVDDATAQVSVQIGAIRRTAVNNGNGTWTLQWSDPLAAGQTYDVLATASDAASNSASDTSSGELTISPDDFAADSGSTGLVTLGGSSTGLLELTGDRDWFAVDLQAGRTYAFQLNGTTLADPFLRLRSGTGVELASHDDISATNPNALINFTASSSGRHWLEASAFNDGGAGGYSLSALDVTPPPPPPILYFSLATAITTSTAAVMGGLTARTNDILAFDGSRFSTWLNGDANGLAGAVLRDFHIVNANEVVVAFNAPVTLAGIAFDDSDLALLRRTATGASISMFLRGRDVGLTTNAEAIDAVTGLADGSWLISTRGGGSVTGVSTFAAEDLLRFQPTATGAPTSGTWSLYADMSDVSLSGGNENITAVDVGANQVIYLATQGNAAAPGLSATNEDVFAFRPTTLGATTSGSFVSPLFFDGSLYGLAANALQGLDVPV